MNAAIELGITPEVQRHLATAAAALRQAIAEVEEAYEAAPEGSDTERRCAEAVQELTDAMYNLEWQPPVGTRGHRRRRAVQP
jgi:hypothetical protein